VLTVAPLHCGEGATSIAICLASAAARTGKRVLLIDADETYRGLSGLFSGAGRTGLAEVLDGSASANKLLLAQPRFQVLPVGRGILPAFERETGTMQAFLRETKERFDLVLVDAPAFVDGMGATAIGRLSDGFVLVVSCDRPIPASFVAAVDALAEDETFAGVVLNRACDPT
jgi:Mrp family chromosome partitioning ATPase